MQFLVKPAISDSASLAAFFEAWQVGRGDLIVTNEYVLAPHLAGGKAPCDTLYQEQYGKGEPSDIMVDAMLDAIAGKEYDRVIAIGGGTVIDIAKLFVFGGGMGCNEIFEKAPAGLPKKRQLIVIPTTCGTGSEVTNIAIVELTQKNTKLGLAVPEMYADEAVLIPSMLSTLPYEVFATSSIDALIHAVESYISSKASPFTRALGAAAIREIVGGYRALTAAGTGRLPQDFSGFLSASTMAGIAFGNAGCAAVHALSYPIGAGYHVPHGMANYMVFSGVFSAYQRLGADLSPLEAVLADALACPTAEVWPALFALLEKVLQNKPLASLGVDKPKCNEMAASVIANQQRLMANNPVALDAAAVEDIYMRCL